MKVIFFILLQSATMYYTYTSFCAGSTDVNKVTKNVSFMDVDAHVDDDAKTATFECFNQLYMEDDDVDDDKAKLTDHDAIIF